MSLLEQFKNKMIANSYDAYIIPTNDYHMSEYVCDYFKSRQLLSKFTGSQGTLVVTKEKAYLWVDGRYFIQASKQIDQNEIELMRIGEKNVPTIIEFLNNYLTDGATLAFDGKVLSANDVLELKNKITKRINIITSVDLVNLIWKDRPALPFSLIYKLADFYTGKKYATKLEELRQKLLEKKVDCHIITSLEEQAYLFNLRANDIPHTPVFLAYTVITNDEVILFVDKDKIDLTINKYLSDNNITVMNYKAIYDYAKQLNGKNILLDLSKVNYELYSLLANSNLINNETSPITLMKAIKNNTEIKNIKIAHERDGLIMTKFMLYLKRNFGKENLTEISVSDYLEKLRSSNKGFVDLSFDTICAYNDHGAMMHYKATKETNYEINGKGGFLLVDSGGHYLEGTTDITRTYALGKITDQMKTHYTLVLKGMINLASATFIKGCTGQNLDILARGPIWRNLIDYKSGTGQGVGYLLSVHEGPNGIRWRKVKERNDSSILEPGMVTTDEPGIYITGQYGIRIENELLCKEKATNEWDTFLEFETITYCPIDLDAIKPSMLTKEEKDWLNDYHQMVFDKYSKLLSNDDIDLLKEYTKKI